MPLNFTQNQLLAIYANDPDICVSAGAGSGKTGVLVERYIRIVDESRKGLLPASQRAGVAEILVVTFTDRATKEVKSRIVQELNERGLADERRLIESAYISTLHGLCSRLLRENPFEAGIDPGFSILDETAAQRMLRQCIDEVVYESFVGHDSEISSLLLDYGSSPGYTGTDLDTPDALAAEAEAILERLRGAGVRLDDIPVMMQKGRRSNAVQDPLTALIQTAYAELAACTDALASLVRNASGSAKRAPALLLETISRMSTATDHVSRIANINAAGAAAARTLADLGASSSDIGLRSIVERMERACKRASLLFNVSAEIENASRLSCRRLLSLIGRAWNRYDDLKRKQAVLDNEDLQAKCVTALEQSAEVRLRCQRQFKHLLIDEFQDTNHLQAQLLDLLHTGRASLSGRRMYHRSDTDVSYNSLFLVGDVQQGIYGFRNADPQIFMSMERECRENNTGHFIRLDENFRSRPEILGLLRQVFQMAWKSAPTPFVPPRCTAHFDDKPGPSIELLIASNMSRQHYAHNEADSLARYIKTIVEHQGSQIVITAHANKQHGSAVGYRDIAVLLRGLNDVQIYEEAFVRHGVPAMVTSGGRGFFARFEIQDLVSVLTLIDSPLDNLALIAALRSPFVGADMDTIYRLAAVARTMQAPEEPKPILFYKALPRLLEADSLPESERDKIEPFLTAIWQLRQDANHLSVGNLIDRLVALTRYDLRLVCRPNGRRKLANVRKLTQMAFSEPGISLGEFIKRTKDLKRLSDREGDAAALEEGEDVVRLMTIHAAKGLEFPVVVLADLSRGLMSRQEGLFACDPLSGSIGSKICGEPDAAFRAIAKQKQETETDECLRLLYVALTRAREHLVLCGNAGRNRGFNWADIVFPALGILSGPLTSERRLLNGGIDALLHPIGLGEWTDAMSTASNYELGDQIASALVRGDPLDALLEPRQTGDAH